MLTCFSGISQTSVSTSGIIQLMMHGLLVMCVGLGFRPVFCLSSPCVPTGDGMSNRVGVTAATHMLKHENYFAVHWASSSRRESRSAY